MNRGDARLVLTVIGTALVTVVLCVGGMRLFEPRDSEVDVLGRKIATLELRIADLEARPAAVVEQPQPPPPAAHAPVLEAPPAEPVPCDEVSCVLNNYEGACCAKFLPARRRLARSGESIDRKMISDGISSVKLQVMACGDRTHAIGQVKIHAVVDPDGTPHVTLRQACDDALGKCVVEAVGKARFAQTENGGSFSYPFVF